MKVEREKSERRRKKTNEKIEKKKEKNQIPKPNLIK